MIIMVGFNVYNFSIGSYLSDSDATYGESLSYYEAYYSSNWDSVLVVAAGNDYLGNQTGSNGIAKDCSVLEKCNDVAINLLFNSTETTIVVGALNDAGDALDSYSTPAGVLKEHYIVAPVWESSGGGRGTSYAAPVVAGVAALLMDNMNDKDAQTIKTRILTTADDLGEAGVDEVFGHGRLNVSRALAPVGGLQ